MSRPTFTTVSQIIGVLSRRGFSPQAVQLYLLLRDLSDEDGRITFTFSDFGDFTCRCKRSFQTALKELYDGKLVSRVGQRSLWVHEIPPLSEQEQIEVITEAGAMLRRMMFAIGGATAPPGGSDNVYYVRFDKNGVDKPSKRKKTAAPAAPADREELALEKLELTVEELQAFKADVRRLGGALGPDVRTVAVDLLVKIVCAQYRGLISRRKISTLCKRAVELRRAGRTARTWVYLRGAVEKILLPTPYTLGEIRPNAEVSEESRQWVALDNLKDGDRPAPAFVDGDEEPEVLTINGMNFV